jgi:hypothetical protein
VIAAAPPLVDTRSEPIVVARSALSTVAENAYAACANAAEAVERAIDAYIADEPLALHQLQRAGFELGELAPSLRQLAFIADNAAGAA